MKALIIGGTKFIGPYVIEELYNKGYQITLFHRGESIISTPMGVKEMYGDRHELQRYRRAFRELRPDVVVDMIEMTEADAKSTIKMFRGIAQRIVVLSSMDVYLAFSRILRHEPGLPVAVPVAETGILRKKYYPYRGKVEGLEDYDKLLVERAYRASKRLPACILRLPYVYGPGDYLHRLYPYVKRMNDERPFILMDRDLADWRMARGFVQDVAQAIGLAADHPNAPGRVYNVADSKTFTELDWARKIAECMGWKGKFILLPRRKLPEHLVTRYNYRQSFYATTGRIRHELGYKEIDTLEKKLLEAIKWELKYPPEGIVYDYAAEDKAASSAL